MQRIRAIMAGSCKIWMTRLRRELAVARLLMILTTPDRPPRFASALFSERIWLETSSVLGKVSLCFAKCELRFDLHSL
jgi:hypothetical protein